MKKRNYVERRLYYSQTCTKCGKPFKSFKRSRVKNGVCRRASCRYSVPSNQQPLFPGSVSPVAKLPFIKGSVSPEAYFPAQILVDGEKERMIAIGENKTEKITTIIGKQDDGSYGISRKVVKK